MGNDIGTVFVVAADGPHKYAVSWQLNNNFDPLDRRPLRYDFTDVTERMNVTRIPYSAEISSSIVPVGAVQGVGVQTHIDIVRAALDQFRAHTTEGKAIIKHDMIEAIRTHRRIGDASLERDLLRLFQAVNSVWPNEEIHIYDLELMFNADESELTAWLSVLEQKSSILARKRKRADQLRGTTRVDGLVYKLNPARREMIHAGIGQDPSKGVRVFLSYSTKDKELAGRIKRTLEEVGEDLSVTVFLAHEDLKVSEQWRERIVAELQECHVFIPLITGKFKGSDWTNQETGIALAGGKKIVPLMCPKKPFGFLEAFQGEFVNPRDVSVACNNAISQIRLMFAEVQPNAIP